VRVFRRFIPSCEVIPFPWGISNRCWGRDGAWCYWVPLNLIVRYASNFWYKLAIPRRFTKLEDSKATAWVIEDLKRENEKLKTKLDVETDGKECAERSFVRAVVLNESLREELNKFLSGERTA